MLIQYFQCFSCFAVIILAQTKSTENLEIAKYEKLGTVRPKIENKKKHQGKHGKYP